jgi:translation initiation factor 2 alpha subunit (eIF-2alpha)
MEFEEGDIVLCTVDRIAGTTVFVNLEGNKEGSIILSEIAPGRIRNLRDYVVPKKKIVCRILKIDLSGNIYLSLRRVTQKERKDIMAKSNQEKNCANMLKTVLGEKTKETIEKISKINNIYDFLQESKENPEMLEKMVGEKYAKKILEILNKQKKKKAVVKKEIILYSTNSDGIKLIKKIFSEINDIEIKYISAGRYSLKIESEDIKKADNFLKETLAKIEEKAKKFGMVFSVKEK